MSLKDTPPPVHKNPQVSSPSALGAIWLIASQFQSRFLTFGVNQVLLSYLTPDLLGISTQLEVYSITVLFFARESFRVAIQRQADTSDKGLKKNDEKIPEDHVDGRTTAGRTQAIVNLAYLSIIIGCVLSIFLGWLYIYTVDLGVSSTPYFSEALGLYAFAAIVELFAEPCYVVVLQKSRFSIRASAEAMATIFRCVLTCGLAIWSSKQGMNLGVLPFAAGQFLYAAQLLSVYYLSVSDIARVGGFSLVIKKIYSRYGFSVLTAIYIWQAY
jgi:oligosaccharide translocation protein RFT1